MRNRSLCRSSYLGFDLTDRLSRRSPLPLPMLGTPQIRMKGESGEGTIGRSSSPDQAGSPGRMLNLGEIAQGFGRHLGG